jgi:type IV secretion system protein VirD4
MSRPRTTGGNGDDLVLWLLGILTGIVGLVWTTAQLAALLSSHRAVHLNLGDVPAVLGEWAKHPGDPRLAFPPGVRSDLPGPVLMYVATAVCLTAAGAAVWAMLRRAGGTESGYAGRREIRDQLSLQAVRRRGKQTRPSLDARRAAPREVGLLLGRDIKTGIALYGSVEDSYLYLGPPRSGKGVNLVIPQCLAAPGAVIVTATRPDTLRATIEQRRGIGPVAVFDPQDISNSHDRLRWSPVRGCVDPLTAILRARALVSGAKLSGLRDGEFWDAMAQAVVRCYLHAADLEGLPVRDVVSWVSRPADPTPVRILRTHAEAAEGWAEELAAQAAADHRQRDSVWACVRRAFDSLADPRVMDSCSPGAAEAFEADRFLDEHGTLYLVGSPGTQLSVAPLVSALIEDVVECGRRRAARSPGGRLDPPLLLLLDEAANIAPIPSLPSLLSDGGGSGITTVAVLQSLAQARGRWGDAHAETMWDAATIKVVLGGLAHAEDLNRISRLAGEIDDITKSQTSGPSGKSVSTTVRRLPALPVERLRGLPVGRAIVLGRRARPVEARLDPYWNS